MILDHYSYKDFKTSFYSRIKKVSAFESGNTNFLKVFLECLVVRYGIKGKIRQYIFYPSPALFINLKRTLLQGNKAAKEGFWNFQKKYEGKTYDVILVDSGRTLLDRNNERISFYYHNIRRFLESKKISFLHYYERHDQAVYPDDFADHAFREFIKFSPLTEYDIQLLRKLQSVYKNVKSENYFTEAEYESIRSGLTVFFETARVWNFYLQKFGPKKICLLGHYHREGIIYAARENKVEVVELQHGLIAEEDIFYVLPEIYKPIKEKGLFADRILTYGKYWNDLLKKGCEYAPAQIKTLGYYLYEDKSGSVEEEKKLQEFCKDSKIVLVTTQPALHKDFCTYLAGWLKTLQPSNRTRFIVKLHPADTESWYDQFKADQQVLITRIRLEVLFKYATIHLTSYSTTIFDAMRYGVKSYSVNFPASTDYVKKMVEEGFSEFLPVNQYPGFETMPGNGVSASHKDFFETPNLELLLS